MCAYASTRTNGRFARAQHKTHRHTDTQTHRHTGARYRAGRRQRPTNPPSPAPCTPPPSPALGCLGVHAVRENGGNGSCKNARRAVELAVKAPAGVTVRRADIHTRSPTTTRSDFGGAALLHIRVLAALVVSVAIPPPPRRVAAANLYTPHMLLYTCSGHMLVYTSSRTQQQTSNPGDDSRHKYMATLHESYAYTYGMSTSHTASARATTLAANAPRGDRRQPASSAPPWRVTAIMSRV